MCGAPRGDHTRDHRDDDQHGGDDRERHGIARVRLSVPAREKLARGHRTSEAERQADRELGNGCGAATET